MIPPRPKMPWSKRRATGSGSRGPSPPPPASTAGGKRECKDCSPHNFCHHGRRKRQAVQGLPAAQRPDGVSASLTERAAARHRIWERGAPNTAWPCGSRRWMAGFTCLRAGSGRVGLACSVAAVVAASSSSGKGIIWHVFLCWLRSRPRRRDPPPPPPTTPPSWDGLGWLVPM
jgi:hypothetical protein